MKRPQLLILMLFVTLIAVFIYADNSKMNLSKKFGRCKKQLGYWQGMFSNWQEMIQDKLPF